MVSDGKGTTLILNSKTFCAFLLPQIGLLCCFLGYHGDYAYFCNIKDRVYDQGKFANRIYGHS